MLQNKPVEVPRFVADVRLCSGAVSYKSAETCMHVHGCDRGPTTRLLGPDLTTTRHCGEDGREEFVSISKLGGYANSRRRSTLLIMVSCCVPSLRHLGDTRRGGLDRDAGHRHCFHRQRADWDWQASVHRLAMGTLWAATATPCQQGYRNVTFSWRISSRLRSRLSAMVAVVWGFSESVRRSSEDEG